jgi:hypothetical protein
VFASYCAITYPHSLQMLLREEQWPLAPLWVEFLEKGGKTPSRDAWCMIIEFFQSVKPDMSD